MREQRRGVGGPPKLKVLYNKKIYAEELGDVGVLGDEGKGDGEEGCR